MTRERMLGERYDMRKEAVRKLLQEKESCDENYVKRKKTEKAMTRERKQRESYDKRKKSERKL